MHMCTSRRLTKTFVGLHIVDLFAFPPCHCLRMCVPAPDWSVGCEQSCSILLLSTYAFAFYSGFFLHYFQADIAHSWWIEITDLLVFAQVFSGVAAFIRVFM